MAKSTGIQAEIRDLITTPNLSYRQRLHQLASFSEDLLDYPELAPAAQDALDTGLVSDLREGHAPYRPRYTLPDYGVALRNGSAYLELEPAQDLEDAITNLQILYLNTPSITSYPVYLGDLDSILMPYFDGQSDEELDSIFTRFWRFLDRTIPDAFTHANIGPLDNPIARSILRVDSALSQVVPNLTLKYSADLSSDALLGLAANSICTVNKPHIANHVMISADFPEGYGVVSCYNTLPLGGGSHTLVRLNLKESGARHRSDLDRYLAETLPHHVELTFQVMEARIRFLVEESGFYDHHFLVKEGLLHQDRFTAMFGIYGLAELVDGMFHGKSRYGWDEDANRTAHLIVDRISHLVSSRHVAYTRDGKASLHSQSGISEDVAVTAGARIPIGSEPDVFEHIHTVAPNHPLFVSGVSDIIALESSVRSNPQAIVDVTKGAFDAGMREMTFNVDGCDLVRVTGYMVKLSDIEKLKEEGSRIASTALGAESVENWGLLGRTPRVISHELDPRPRR